MLKFRVAKLRQVISNVELLELRKNQKTTNRTSTEIAKNWKFAEPDKRG